MLFRLFFVSLHLVCLEPMKMNYYITLNINLE